MWRLKPAIKGKKVLKISQTLKMKCLVKKILKVTQTFLKKILNYNRCKLLIFTLKNRRVFQHVLIHVLID